MGIGSSVFVSDNLYSLDLNGLFRLYWVILLGHKIMKSSSVLCNVFDFLFTEGFI